MCERHSAHPLFPAPAEQLRDYETNL
jgi:hypothetical protein